MMSHYGSAHWAVDSLQAGAPHHTALGEAYATPNRAVLLIMPALLIGIALLAGSTPCCHFLPIK